MVTSKQKVIYTPAIKGRKSTSRTQEVILCDHCGSIIPTPEYRDNKEKCYICGRHTCGNCRIEDVTGYTTICKECSGNNPRIKAILLEKHYVGEAESHLTNLSIKLQTELNQLSYLSGKGKYLGSEKDR
jgi:hypothetical protein